MTLATRTRVGVGEVRISAQARANVLDVLDRSRLSYGRWSKEFERRFAALHGRRFACFVNSGTDALRIGLAAMKERYGWRDGDVVLVPALTFVASYNVVRQVGLTPLLVDIDEHYGMDAQQVGAILGRYEAGQMPQPVAVMPVHLFGQTASPSLVALASGMGLRVIADSCETMFVPGCAVGDVSCFSTYACHLMSTGVGGIATTNDPEMARLVRSLANHGRDGIYTGIDDVLGNVEVIQGRFRFERMGYSSRATEMEAAIGCAELDDWERSLALRRQNAAALTRMLGDLPLALPKVRPGGEHAWMMYPLRTSDHVTRDRLVQHLEGCGVETRYLLPLTSQPYMKALGVVEDHYPVAKRANQTGFYIGCHPQLSAADLAQIDDAFHSFRW